MGSKLYSYAFLGFSSGSVIQYLSHNYLVKFFGQKGYTYCFIVYGCLMIIGLIVNYNVELK